MPIVVCLMWCNGSGHRMLILNYVRSALYMTAYMCGLLVGKCTTVCVCVCVYFGVNYYRMMVTQPNLYVCIHIIRTSLWRWTECRPKHVVECIVNKMHHNYWSAFDGFLYALDLINSLEMEHIKTDRLSKMRIILFYWQVHKFNLILRTQNLNAKFCILGK
jgi:hypothetical protein